MCSRAAPSCHGRGATSATGRGGTRSARNQAIVGHQLVDISAEEHPPSMEETIPPTPVAPPGQAGLTADQVLETQQLSPAAPASTQELEGEADQSSSYAPTRTRVRTKNNPLSRSWAVARPAEMQPEDLTEMLEEVLPRVLSQASQASGERPTPGDVLESPHEPAFKRLASSSPDALRAEAGTEATHGNPPSSIAVEALFCQATMDAVRDECPGATEFEVLLAGFLQKKMQKELPASGNEQGLQTRIDEAKVVEWQTMLDKAATRVLKGKDAAHARTKHPDRFIGSRFVVTQKDDEDGKRLKARWCLQGHLDPDVMSKVAEGACHSPTMSQMSRALVLQILVSMKWQMCLGDIKGAFLESGPLQAKYRPLFAKQPAGGIPGLSPDDVIEVIGNVYGLNDAPFWWWQTFDKEARALGFERSQFDSCVYFF